MIFFVVALFGVVLIQGEWIRKCRGWMGEAEREVRALRLRLGGSREGLELAEGQRFTDAWRDWTPPRGPL